MIAFAGILLPMALCCLDILLRGTGLDKMMYLCPMSREERKKYIYGVYCFSVAVRMMIALTGVCIIIPFSHCGLFSAVHILLNDFLIAVMTGAEGSMEKDKTNKEVQQQILTAALSFISNIIETAVVAGEAPELFVKPLLLGIFVIIQLPMALKYGRYQKQKLDDAVYYETWQRRTT